MPIWLGNLYSFDMTSETLPKTDFAVAARGLTKTYGHDTTRVEALREWTYLSFVLDSPPSWVLPDPANQP